MLMKNPIAGKTFIARFDVATPWFDAFLVIFVTRLQ